MSFGDTIGYQDEGEACLVCGKGLRRDEALAHMHHEGQRLPICCPLCLDAWQKDPKSYIERLAKRAFLRELRKSGATPFIGVAEGSLQDKGQAEQTVDHSSSATVKSR